MTSKSFLPIQSCCMPIYFILGSMVPELHAVRMVCLLKAVTPAWVTNTVSFSLVIEYIRYHGSFEALQANVKSLIRSGLRVRPSVPQTNITLRAVDHLMYIPCILLRVGWGTSWKSFMIFGSTGGYLHNIPGLFTLGSCNSYAQRRVSEKFANELRLHGLSILLII